jgi:hypothetical protein
LLRRKCSSVGDEAACIAYLVARRWPNGVICPRCGNGKCYALASGHHWQCEQCAVNGYRFSHLAGTIFENTNKPLRDWFKITHLILASKKGMSARQLGRYMGFGSVKTAWLMAHKIRAALIEPEEKLGGIVEVDETFVGGRAKNRHADKRDGIPGTHGIRQSNYRRRCTPQGQRGGARRCQRALINSAAFR